MTGAPVVVDDDDTQRVTGADDDDTQRVMTGTAADDDDDDDTERPTDTSTTASIPPLFTDSIDADAPLFNCSGARMVCACVDDPHPIVRQASSVCERTRRAAPSLTFAARLASLPRRRRSMSLSCRCLGTRSKRQIICPTSSEFNLSAKDATVKCQRVCHRRNSLASPKKKNSDSETSQNKSFSNKSPFQSKLLQVPTKSFE